MRRPAILRWSGHAFDLIRSPSSKTLLPCPPSPALASAASQRSRSWGTWITMVVAPGNRSDSSNNAQDSQMAGTSTRQLPWLHQHHRLCLRVCLCTRCSRAVEMGRDWTSTAAGLSNAAVRRMLTLRSAKTAGPMVSALSPQISQKAGVNSHISGTRAHIVLQHIDCTLSTT